MSPVRTNHPPGASLHAPSRERAACRVCSHVVTFDIDWLGRVAERCDECGRRARGLPPTPLVPHAVQPEPPTRRSGPPPRPVPAPRTVARCQGITHTTRRCGGHLGRTNTTGLCQRCVAREMARASAIRRADGRFLATKSHVPKPVPLCACGAPLTRLAGRTVGPYPKRCRPCDAAYIAALPSRRARDAARSA